MEYFHCRVMIRIRPQQFRIMPVPFMIGMGQQAIARQARSGRVILTPTEAKAATLVVEDLPSLEIAAKRLL
jgi:hypothetical protein